MPVTEEECIEMRNLKMSGKTAEEVTNEFEYSRTTILNHCRGDCKHSDENILEKVENNNSVKVTSDMCDEMRVLAKGGMSIKNIKSEFGLSKGGVFPHIYGECSCSNEVRQVSEVQNNITEDTCGEIREKYIECGSSYKLSNEYGLDPTTIQYHLRADCNHHDESVLDNNLSKTECTKIRNKAINGKSEIEIADEFEITEQTLNRHLKGNCHHNVECEILVMRDLDVIKNSDVKLRKSECFRIRQLYFDESRDIDELSKMLDFGGRTIMYHINGACSHNFGEDEEFIVV